MIAYFALLSFVPLLFLALALLGLVHQADENSFFVRELSKTFPSTSVNSILTRGRAIQANATALGIVGGAFLLWSSLSFFSVLESAFNIVYGRPNRGFLHGKALATMMMVGSLVVAVRLARDRLGRAGDPEALRRLPGQRDVARVIAIIVSTLGLFVFLIVGVLRADERRPDAARGAARRDRRGGDPRGEFQVLPSTSTSRSTTPCCRRSPAPRCCSSGCT